MCHHPVFSLLHWFNLESGFFPPTNLSCVAGAGGGKPGRRHGCFCRRPPAGGDQIVALQLSQPASGPPRGAGGRSVVRTIVQRRPGPTGRWVKDDLKPSDRSTGSGWPGQNPPEEGKIVWWWLWGRTDKRRPRVGRQREVFLLECSVMIFLCSN